MVWVCDVRRGLRRKVGDGNGSTREEARGRPKRRWLYRVKDYVKKKALSGWKCATELRRRISSNIDPLKSGNKMKSKKK